MNSNQTSPAITGGAAITGVMLGGVVMWICDISHLAVPPADVAGTIGAIVLVLAHIALNKFTGQKDATPHDVAKN